MDCYLVFVEKPDHLSAYWYAQSPAILNYFSGVLSWGRRGMVMDVMKDSDSEAGNMTFFSQALDRAIVYRVSFAQREMHNYPALERDVPDRWDAVRQSDRQKAWESVV